MMMTIPNRLAYFDEQQFDMSTEPPRLVLSGTVKSAAGFIARQRVP